MTVSDDVAAASAWGPVWLISGSPGVGKSTVSELICQDYDRGVHISVDTIRDMVRSGYSSPLDPWTEETFRQFALARRAAARMARDYSSEGFGVVIDDVITERVTLGDYAPYLEPIGLRKILLHADLDTLLARNQLRQSTSFDPSSLVAAMTKLQGDLLQECSPGDGWLVVDTTNLSARQTQERLRQSASTVAHSRRRT